mgnify:CR=1 FL=1|jgi:CheY-like chemotaxis protein
MALNASKGKVLVVDDAPAARVRLAQWLTQNSYNSIFVYSEAEAEDMLKHHRFDMVVHSREFSFPSPYPVR